MQIVPLAQALEVEATIDNRDVGFVQEGQRAEVKVEAFEFSKYGTVPAQVRQVSRDAVADEKKGLLYTTRIHLDHATMDIDGKPQQLAPGMAVTVAIKTGSRRLIDYVLSPLIQHRSEALHER